MARKEKEALSADDKAAIYNRYVKLGRGDTVDDIAADYHITPHEAVEVINGIEARRGEQKPVTEQKDAKK